ncbi:MAG: hypothetical protein JWQ08_1747 [Deinococcus sp.]|nr:hypothetical protein [Deinococcus sp.]
MAPAQRGNRSGVNVTVIGKNDGRNGREKLIELRGRQAMWMLPLGL